MRDGRSIPSLGGGWSKINVRVSTYLLTNSVEDERPVGPEGAHGAVVGVDIAGGVAVAEEIACTARYACF